MRLNLRRWILVAPLALLIAGCAYNDRVDNRTATFDIAIERSRDEMILTNIIRASRAEPLAFVSLGQLTGGTTIGGQLGLPSVVLGPAAPTAAIQTLQSQAVFGANAATTGYANNFMTMSGSTQVNVTPAETKDFYLGLLSVVQPETLGFFSEQGIAPELLFYLFTDKILETKNGVVKEYRNDPLDPSFPEFRNYVGLAMRYGLTAEPQPGVKPTPQKQSSDKSGKKDDTGPPHIPARLCFDKSHWAPETPAAGNTPLCGSKVKSQDERTVYFLDPQGTRVTLKVLPRSTFAIFQFLGRLVATQEPILLTSQDAIGRGPLVDQKLFVVTNGSPGGCFLETVYGGQHYCVPDNALNTKRILGLLAQLIALNTSVNELPFTPQVQLVR
ncbi:MAG: hypothetical protein ACLP8A_01765 [Methylovirgula sp.]